MVILQMASGWRSVSRCRAPEDLYPLLVKFETSITGYAIHLTNLVHIWSEKLERKDIVRRALDVDTSIDPSEGGDQFKLLLQKLHNAVDGQPHTSLSLSEVADNGLQLQATVSLPSPLPPLIWPFHLRSATPELFSYELVLPCLSSIVQTKTQVSSLLTSVKEKDQVIRRLLDKLRSAGIELNTIYPNLPLQRTSKSNSREVIVNSVKGLSEFNEEKWRASMNASLEPGMHTEFLCEQVLTGDDFGIPRVELPPSLRRWRARRELVNVSPNPERHLASSPSAHRYSSKSADIERNIDASEEEFQTTPRRDQTTSKNTGEDEDSLPIRAAATSEMSKSPDTEFTTSGSDDDLDIPSHPAKPEITLATGSELSNITKPKKLGLIGGKQKIEPFAMPVTNFSSEDDRKPPSKLGIIGGKARQWGYNEKVADGTTSSTNVASGSVVGSEPPSKLTASERTGRSLEVSPLLQAHNRETSEERADRKREQLKRELEEKSKVQVKKKRKF